MINTAPQSTRQFLINKPSRLYYLDWLRIISVFSVFLTHNSQFFGLQSWLINNAESNLVAVIFADFLYQWMMPLLFVLSGAAMYYSLKSMTTASFLKARVRRLLIPLLGIGWFIIAPPIVYLQRLSHGEFDGTFFQFYPYYFDGLYGLGGNFAWMGIHLWYLMYLFFFSLIILPLVLPRGKTGTSILSRTATLFERPWMLLLLFLPVNVSSWLASVLGLDISRAMGGWDILSYPLFFTYGFLIFSNSRILQTINKYTLAIFIMALILTLVYFVLIYINQPPRADMAQGLRPPLAWCWILAMIGLGNRFLNSNGRFLRYATEAVMPFYVLHLTIIIVIGFFIVQWNLSILLKYLIISTSSFIAIIVIYECIIRRTNALRILFGMNPKNSKIEMNKKRGC